MAVQIPAQAIRDAQGASSSLWQVLLAIAGPESNWNPRAEGDYKLAWGGDIVPRNTPGAFPTSFGYLQYHVDGGLGDGIGPDVLKDGPTNMRLGAGYIQGRLNNGASLYQALQPWSTRPAALALLERIKDEGYEAIGDSPNPNPNPGPGPAPLPIEDFGGGGSGSLFLMFGLVGLVTILHRRRQG